MAKKTHNQYYIEKSYAVWSENGSRHFDVRPSTDDPRDIELTLSPDSVVSNVALMDVEQAEALVDILQRAIEDAKKERANA